MESQVNESLTRIWLQLMEIKETKDNYIKEESGYIPISLLEDLQKIDRVLENIENQLRSQKVKTF